MPLKIKQVEVPTVFSWESGKSVNERSSMQMTAVYSCVRILSEAVASLPLHFYEYGLLRGDYQSRMNGYTTARQNG